jgi:death-on-curing protein
VTEPIWLDERDARAVHDRSLVLHGGAPGVRDAGLLDSALARPRQLAAYGDSVHIVDLAAAYTCGLIKNNPFLELNGVRFTASEEDATRAVMALAAGDLDAGGYTAFLSANSHPEG